MELPYTVKHAAMNSVSAITLIECLAHIDRQREKDPEWQARRKQSEFEHYNKADVQ